MQPSVLLKPLHSAPPRTVRLNALSILAIRARALPLAELGPRCQQRWRASIQCISTGIPVRLATMRRASIAYALSLSVLRCSALSSRLLEFAHQFLLASLDDELMRIQ